MNKNKKSLLVPIVAFFLLTTIFFLTAKNFIEKKGFDQSVLITGNLVLFAVTMFTFWLNKRNISAANPNVFVRGIMLGTMLKLFIFAITAFIYIYLFRSQLNKPALLTCMGFYFIYTLMEVSILTKLLKGKKNA
jgi:hypothetical protein